MSRTDSPRFSHAGYVKQQSIPNGLGEQFSNGVKQLLCATGLTPSERHPLSSLGMLSGIQYDYDKQDFRLRVLLSPIAHMPARAMAEGTLSHTLEKLDEGMIKQPDITLVSHASQPLVRDYHAASYESLVSAFNETLAAQGLNASVSVGRHIA